VVRGGRRNAGGVRDARGRERDYNDATAPVPVEGPIAERRCLMTSAAMTH